MEGTAAMNRVLQFAISLLRVLHIDVYSVAIRVLYRWRWYRACALKPAEDTSSLCIAVELNFMQSFAQVGRDFIDKMRAAAMPFHVYDMSVHVSNPRRMDRTAYERYLPFTRKFISDPVVLFFSPAPFFPTSRICVPQLFWEFESGYIERGADFSRARHYVVFSDFCFRFFQRIMPVGCQVHKIRYPYVPGRWKQVMPSKVVRDRYGMAERGFIVFFHFDAGSCCERKNPEGVVRAFAAGLRDAPDALLVIKTMYYDETSAYARRLSELISSLGIKQQVRIVNDCIPYQDVLDLIASSDVYISLHRGEGLGLGMMEAMALGTPVVCTNYGGNTDFTTPDTAFLVDYKMIPAITDNGVYKYVKEWPEPDVAQAAEYLRQLYNDIALGSNKAEYAMKYLADFFSTEHFSDDVRAFLKVVISNRAKAKK